MRRPVKPLFRDEELVLRWLPGTTPRLVVVFTGMKRGVGGETLDEFAASASCGGENAVLFVTDRRITWFAAPGLWARTVDMIREIIEAEGIEEVITLGNSMGGYAAMLLPRDIPVRRAIAFAPQITMDREILDDARWPDVKSEWGDLPVRNLADTVSETRTHYFAFASRDCAEDVAHLDLLPRQPRMHRFLLASDRHNPARTLKEKGVLGRVVAAIVRGRRQHVAGLLEKTGIAA
ncbi:hypothetical protein [Jannaschia aquimarina]|uniref:Alpha/beta hydrolase family protein n=1 Tax=Jannaschia aquimarina TaxID=935700 RepID=A0A0D1EBK0_9RHOB|nr:hypothetical protein [Jannaschia aquimarina]KIT15119.1 hypothetical protein jaqu_34470 [Jannaschia aquimarina]SNS64580.1 hypothetical protein SAMN05421775_101773 [Jannaschia aquimarina]